MTPVHATSLSFAPRGGRAQPRHGDLGGRQRNGMQAARAAGLQGLRQRSDDHLPSYGPWVAPRESLNCFGLLVGQPGNDRGPGPCVWRRGRARDRGGEIGRLCPTGRKLRYAGHRAVGAARVGSHCQWPRAIGRSRHPHSLCLTTGTEPPAGLRRGRKRKMVRFRGGTVAVHPRSRHGSHRHRHRRTYLPRGP